MIELILAGEIARLTLSRPEACNAIPVASWPDLADGAGRAVAGGARLLLVSGSGGAFCAGADLSGFPALRGDIEARSRFRLAMRDALDRLARLPIPTVALIEGACFGAGVALAMACDLRIAARSATFAITPAKIGISYPQEDIHRLVALVGPGQAARLLLTAGTIDAVEAQRIGLVESLAEDGIEAAGTAIAETLLANSMASFAALKRGIALAVAGAASDAEQELAFEALFGADDVAERLARLGRRR